MALTQQLDPDLERMVQQRRMGYLGEQALLRSINQQRMLQGLEPVADLASAVGGRPGKIRQTETPPLQVQMPQGGGPQVTQYTPPQDNSLAAALGGIGSGGGLQQMLARMQAMRDQRAVPTPNVVRGHDLPSPRTAGTPGKPATTRDAVVGRRPPQPGDASSTRQTPSPAAVSAEPSPGQSGILARQRAPYAAQMDANPAVKEKMMALMLAEEGGDRDARTALAESAYNRGASRNINSIDQVLDPRYYQPMHDGSGNYEKALQRIRTDPRLRAEVAADLARATGGSNVSKLATDNASGQVAANSMTNQTHTHTTANGERWFRKDVRPDVHGPLAVRQTQDWHANTSSAMVDEKPEPAAAPKPGTQAAAQPPVSPPAPAAAETPPAAQASGGPPQWLKDTVSNYATEKGLPPGNIGSVDQPLSKEALLTHGLNRLDEKAAEAAPSPQQPAQAPQMTPQIGQAAISATQPSAPKRSDSLRSALWSATRTDRLPVPALKPDLPAPATAPAPPVLAQGADETPQAAQAQPTLPQGNAPQQFIDAATTGQIPPQLSAVPQVQTSWEPPPQLQQSQLGLNTQPFGQGNLSPIPWDWMGGWGWGPQAGFDTGRGWGGSFDTGFSGFDFFGGGNMGGW
ncbi:hypothetical protein ABIG06_006235 [Bradyrhizobium sp. USDA 326]|uniref:hypothetical protein n=1 Tax=unclassified Bradyrhizobium TaxID=2631580 RepID=UPI003513EC2E